MKYMTFDQVASALGVSHPWLRMWLKENPFDSMGQPFYKKAGKKFVFQATCMQQLRTDIGLRRVRKRPRDGGEIYFIAGGDLIKIGYSQSATKRLGKMRTDCPVELKILHKEPGCRDTEESLHRDFAASHVHGEWFRTTPELIALIEQKKIALLEPLPRPG